MIRSGPGLRTASRSLTTERIPVAHTNEALRQRSPDINYKQICPIPLPACARCFSFLQSPRFLPLTSLPNLCQPHTADSEKYTMEVDRTRMSARLIQRYRTWQSVESPTKALTAIASCPVPPCRRRGSAAERAARLT